MNPEVFQAASTGKLSFFDENSNSTLLLQVTVEKNTVLHVALQFKQVKAAEKILNLRPSLVLRTNAKGNTPLHVAAMVGASSMVKILIQKAKDERDVEAGGQQLLRTVNQDGDTALHVAVRYDNDEFEIVKELIMEDQELAKYVNNAGESALFLAVDRQHYVMALHVLNNAPNCFYAGRHGMNVLHALVIHTSSYSNKGDFLPKFLKFWEQVGLEREGRVLIAVVWIFHMLFLKPLPEYLTRRQDVSDPIDSLRLLRLLFLEENFPKDFVNKVVEKWPSAIKEGDDSGWTPLHIAAHLGNEKFVKLLLKNGNSPAYIRNKEGLSALHIAAKEDKYLVINELMKACPDMYELLDNKGRNALHAASESGGWAAFDYFKWRPEIEGLINQQDEDGNTPTNLAAINGHFYSKDEFGEGRRVALNATNKDGFTTMDNILLIEKLGSRPTTKVWSEGARPSLRGVLLKMGIQESDPRKKSEMAGDGTGNANGNDKGNGNGKGMSKSDLNEGMKDTVVATLIATVTFTAAFTVPGGFKQNGSVDEGLAVLSNRTAFRVFLIANTLAFGLSITSLLVQFLASAMIKDVNFHRQMVRRAPIFTNWSIGALLVAFIAGNYTVVPQSFGITAAVILSCCFLYCLFLPLSIKKGKEKPIGNYFEFQWLRFFHFWRRVVRKLTWR